MSKIKRKVTVDSDDRRKPSVFERLGPGATRRSYGNYDDSDSDREAVPQKCLNWFREGNCPYGSKCKFQHGPFSGSKGKGRHEADNTEDLRLRVKRKDKAIEKAGSDTDESEASRLRELDFKKELQLEQERQRIQRELSQLDDEENVRGGRENFIIEKKIMAAKVSSSDSDSDRSRNRSHKKGKKKKKRKISKSPSKRSPSPGAIDSDDHHKSKHKKKGKSSGKKKRRESLEEIPKMIEPDIKGRKLLSPLKFKKSHKPMMSQKISAFHSEEEEEPPQQPQPKPRLQRSLSSSSDDLIRAHASRRSKEKRSLSPIKKKKQERKLSPEYMKEVKRKHAKGIERSISKGRERSRSSSVDEKKVKKMEKKKLKKEEYYERRKDVDFAQRPPIMAQTEKDRDHTPMSDFRDFSPGPELVKKKKEKKKDKKKKDRDLSISREEFERKHKKDKLKNRERTPSPSTRYAQKMEKRALERSLERGSRREIDPRVRSPAAKGLRDPYAERREDRSPTARYKDEIRKERERELRDPRALRDPRELSREGRELREGRDPREGRDIRERDPRELREARDPRDPSRGREGERLEFDKDREREREYERRAREAREPHASEARGRPPAPPGSFREPPPGRGEYERAGEVPPREPGQERYPPEFRDDRRDERYGPERDPHYPPPPPGYEERGYSSRDRYPKPGERDSYGRPERPPDREPMERRDPGDRYDRYGDPRGRGEPRFEGATLGPRPPYDYRDPNWDRGRGRGGPHPRPWGRGGPPDRRYDERSSRRSEFENRRDEFYVPERRDWPNRREGEERREDRKDQPRAEDKDRPEEKKDEEKTDQENRERKVEADEKDRRKEEPERQKEEDREKKETDESRDRSRKRPASHEEPAQSPVSKRTREGSPALSTHSRKSGKSGRNLDKEGDLDKLSERGSDRSRHTARSKGREDKPGDVDEGKGESKKSRTPERKRSRSRSVDGSASGDSKRRKTSDKQAKDEGGETGAGFDSIEQHFSDWSDNDSDDDILNQPDQGPPPGAIPFERGPSPGRIPETGPQKLEESREIKKELVPGVPEQDVADFESISSEESSLLGVVKTAAVNALEIDWASLARDERPKPTTGSALQRFKPATLFSKMGLSRQYAGEDLYKEVASLCQRQEDGESGETTKTETEKEVETGKESEKEVQQTENREQEKFEFKHDIAMFHSSALRKLKERAGLLSDIGSFRRALCSRRDLEIRRQLCKVDKVLDHTQVYPSQEIDNEVCKLSIQLFRKAKPAIDKPSIDTDRVPKQVTFP